MSRGIARAELVKLAVVAAALLAWMAFIFYMSAKTGGASGGMSESVAAWLAQLLCPDWADMPADARAELLARMSLPVRKGAHITEYAILAALAFTAFSQARFVRRAGVGAGGAMDASDVVCEGVGASADESVERGAGAGAGAGAGEDAGAGGEDGGAGAGTGAGAGEDAGASRAIFFIALAAFAFSTLYAASDEFHQLFVPGRAGLFTDVAIDSCGAALGSALAALVAWRRRACRIRRREGKRRP